jgi:translation initiation factor 2B subunit (eIF-2B alpha/beta/delta family)
MNDLAAIEEILKGIASDNRSGAAEILARAAKIFQLLSLELKPASIEEAQDALSQICAALVRAQPNMAPLLNLASAALNAASSASTADQVVSAASDAARDFVNWARRAAERAAQHAAQLITDGTTILTHSRSSTVVSSLVLAKRAGRRFRVIATESRPLLEGRSLALELADHSIEVAIIADAAAALALEETDLVLLGADKITPDSLINKIGTCMMALAARERGRPIYAICDRSKFTSATIFSQELRSRTELWPDAPPQIAIINHYFEPTPLGLFAGIITEEGLLSPEAASRRAAIGLTDEPQ